jgi:hypothetical protein
MLGFFRNKPNFPSISRFSLKQYKHTYSLDRLVLGVDNIRYDVYLSPTYINVTRKIAARLVARHAGVEKSGSQPQQDSWVKEVDGYKQLYREIMRDAVNKAKGRREVQIEYLAQSAVLRMLLTEIRTQYDHLVGRLKNAVRKSDLAVHNDIAEAPKLKGKLQGILQERDAILQQVGKEMSGFMADVEVNVINQMHEAIFGPRHSLYTDLLDNPVLHAEHPDSELFMISEYDIVLGRRIEDPDKYETLLFFVRQILNNLDLMDPSSNGHSVEQRLALSDMDEDSDAPIGKKAYNEKIESWLSYIGNVDRLLNWQHTRGEFQALKKKKGSAKTLGDLRQRIKAQKKLLNFFYREFRRNGLVERIIASYEMQPEYLEYCPPLIPQQIIQYLTVPKSRKVIRNRLKRMKKVYNRSFPLRPLYKKIKSMEQMTTAKRRAYLIRFLNAFARYHRDKSNADLIREAMERVNIATEEKVVTLSRENNTLYEFLLPHEREAETAPIINHVVIKADVRGSTDITHQMNERGLNPASYFSLNFFDPISEILAEYDTNKIFIEGDAIILSLFERKDTPSGWYGVARACGLALNMLIIIQRYNKKNQKYQLPIMELGIGISYLDKAPTFLFDGNNRIMISSAINQADRLSSCSKTGRKMFADKKGPFNLYVFQTLSDEEIAGTADDLYMRYNVNGIELSAAGFEKLSNEIDLKMLEGDFSDQHNLKSRLYSGRFPTQSGRYQRLIIREAQIPVVDGSALTLARVTSRKYYEVCTHPKLYAWAKQKQATSNTSP